MAIYVNKKGNVQKRIFWYLSPKSVFLKLQNSEIDLIIQL